MIIITGIYSCNSSKKEDCFAINQQSAVEEFKTPFDERTSFEKEKSIVDSISGVHCDFIKSISVVVNKKRSIEQDSTEVTISTFKYLNSQYEIKQSYFSDSNSYSYSVNNKEMNKFNVKINDLEISERDMNISFEESFFYEITTTTQGKLLLILSKSQNWTGLMSNLNYYQILNINKNSIATYFAD